MPLTRKLSTKSLIKQNTSQDSSNSANQTITKNTFTASGVGPYSLTVSPGAVNNTQVYINGVYQEKNNYTLAGNQITFSVAPPAGTSIEVISGSSYNIGTPNDGSVTTAKISSGAAALGTVLTSNGAGSVSFTNATLPTVQRFTSGSGTYNTPANCKYIKVRMVGGGGAGGGGSTASTATTFGTSLLTANGGSAGAATGNTATCANGGQGGTATVNSPAITLVAASGAGGGGGGYTAAGGSVIPGGIGASSPFGGGGASGFTGQNGAANTGSGGSCNSALSSVSGGGGGAGGYIEAIIVSPLTSYSYTVGTGGSGGSGGTGGSGVIIVEEYYQ